MSDSPILLSTEADMLIRIVCMTVTVEINGLTDIHNVEITKASFTTHTYMGMYIS